MDFQSNPGITHFDTLCERGGLNHPPSIYRTTLSTSWATVAGLTNPTTLPHHRPLCGVCTSSSIIFPWVSYGCCSLPPRPKTCMYRREVNLNLPQVNRMNKSVSPAINWLWTGVLPHVKLKAAGIGSCPCDLTFSWGTVWSHASIHI